MPLDGDLTPADLDATLVSGGQGPAGATGATGPAGHTPVFTIGTVVTGTPAAVVAFTSEEGDVALQFTIPAGATGATGDTGATGPAGTTAAGDLTGTTLASNVVTSSLTSVGTLAGLTSSGAVSVTDTTASSSSTTGACKIAGGLGVEKDSWINGVRIGQGPGTASATNLVIGSGAGALMTGAITGSTFVGYEAGSKAVAATINGTFVGSEAGQYQTGTNNCYIGWAAGRGVNGSTTGNSNNGMGRGALAGLTTGSNDCAVGYSAGGSLTTGGFDVFFGTTAGYGATTNNHLVGIGYDAIAGLTGAYHYTIGVGSEAGRWYGASPSVTSLTQATSCIFIGRQSRALANTATNEIVIGDSAVGDGSNTVVLGNSSHVSHHLVGTTTGVAILDGNRLRIKTTKTPSSASDTGVTGDLCWDSSYIYVCTATNTWKRTAISTW